jgi:integrase
VPRSIARVVRRGDVFYFRMAVPVRWVTSFGKSEIKLSLRTCDPVKSRLWGRSLSNAFDVLFLELPHMPSVNPQVVKERIWVSFQALMGRQLHSGGVPRRKPLLKDDLFAVLDVMGDTLKDARDHALLVIGFAGGFRRSELVAIDIGAVEFVRRGAIITVPRSKTDQLGAGRKVGVPLGRTRHCPVAALEGWIKRAGLSEGPVFRPVDRHGCIHPNALTGEAVSLVIKERVAAAGMDPLGFSGHSLRSGLATSAAQVGVSSRKIRQQTGHISDAMLARYIRDGELFSDNAAGALL